MNERVVMVDREAIRMILANHEVAKIVTTAFGHPQVYCDCGYICDFCWRADHLTDAVMGGVASWLITED